MAHGGLGVTAQVPIPSRFLSLLWVWLQTPGAEYVLRSRARDAECLINPHLHLSCMAKRLLRVGNRCRNSFPARQDQKDLV
ncbi:hypothetical protein F5X96DRAFT_626067 [Biscogniauxia mediterranea]|nr:hypothetical protein F5X96DRAFT_626067 [Biscogniauxia mediterranea]